MADVLIGRIDGGELIVGDKLPSELDLAEEFQVSRATVVKALRILERSSYVSKNRTRRAADNNGSQQKSKGLKRQRRTK